MNNLISKPLCVAPFQSKTYKCLANQENGKLKPRDPHKNLQSGYLKVSMIEKLTFHDGFA